MPDIFELVGILEKYGENYPTTKSTKACKLYFSPKYLKRIQNGIKAAYSIMLSLPLYYLVYQLH